MDEKKLEDVKPGDSLPSLDFVYRVALQSERDLDESGNHIPRLKCFSLSPADIEANYKLSVDWEKKTTPEEVLIRWGTSFKRGKNTEYKPFDNRVLYKLNVGFLQKLPFILDVIYSPSHKNNAHSSICFDNEQFNYKEHEPEFLTELRDHAKQFIIKMNMDEVRKKVEEKRKAVLNNYAE